MDEDLNQMTRDELIAEEPEVYYLKPHYEDYACVLVRLKRIRPDAMRDLLAMGWQFVNKKAPRRRSSQILRSASKNR